MNPDQKRLFLAVGLSAAVLFIFQSYFAPKKLPQDNVSKTAVAQQKLGNEDESYIPSENKPEEKETAEPVNKELKEYTLNGEKSSVSLTNYLGMTGFSNEDAKYDFKKIMGTDKTPFSILVKIGNVYKKVPFSVEQNGNILVGKNSNLGISFKGSIDPQRRLNLMITSTTPQLYRLVFRSQEESLDNRQVRKFSFFGGNKLESFDVGDEDNYDGQIKWVGLDFNFHLYALVFDKKRPVRITNNAGVMTVDLVEPSQSFQHNYVFVKKNYDLLAKLGDQLQLSVDFGLFGIIAVPILRGIQFVYKYIPNYGIAIILLTILLRFITFPLYYKSIISMKKMQKVQPELTKLREKYKDDPKRMQKETMELFKRAGANPLGGCLPMILQMPVFFAFYQVLYNAVELVNAPFMGWITDLSSKDPIYVLPVAMAIAMFVQQKLTPTTSADPTQQKIMMFMPLIFGFIMKDLPSGLVLYIFVSTLFGIIQQLVVYKVTD